jgi:hypothetical protein
VSTIRFDLANLVAAKSNTNAWYQFLNVWRPLEAVPVILFVQYFFHPLNDFSRLVHDTVCQCLQLLAGRWLQY